jgi:hypothetical protein
MRGSEGRRIRVQRCQAVYENEKTRNTLRATRRIITHCTNRPTFRTKARKGVIAVEIHTSLCSPQRVFAVLPKVLLLSCPTVLTLTLSSPGPEQRIRSHQITMINDVHLLLLFMVLEDVFDLLCECFKAEPLVYNRQKSIIGLPIGAKRGK